MSCKVRAALTQGSLDADNHFSEAMRAMTGDHIGKLSRAEYMVLRAQVEEARRASENACLAVERHRHEHGC